MIETGNNNKGTYNNEGGGNNNMAGKGIVSLSEGATLSGTNIFNGRGNFNITCVSCDSVGIMDNCSGITVVNSNKCHVGMGVSGCSLINCSGVTILAGVSNFSAVGLQNQVISTSYSGNFIQIDQSNSATKQANFTSSLDKRYYWCDGSLLLAPNTLTVTLGLKDDLQPIPIQTFKRMDNTAGITITLSAQGGRLIDGAATSVITTQYEARTVYWDAIEQEYYIV